MPMIDMSICQFCDEQQIRNTVIFSVVKLDLCIRALLLDHILALKETSRTPLEARVHLV